MEKGAKRPDGPAVSHATVRAAVTEAARHFPALPLIAGGKSFGGRMTSQAQSEGALPGVRGLAFFGFPLHRAGKPSTERAKHLFDAHVPMLFLQGSRDKLAELTSLQPLIHALGPRATLCSIEHADHSFHVPLRSGQTDGGAMDETLDAFADWVGVLLGQQNTA
jgi:predicted alpha/beta-hydrolase family hydrolase